MSLGKTNRMAPTTAQTGETNSSGINWAALYHRLEASRAALKRKLNPNDEEKRKILRARARSLATKEKEKLPNAQLEVVEFTLSSEHYAIESNYIREIYPLSEFTPLPCTPPFVLGLVNVRGQIISIINIKKLFELPEKGLTDLNKVIIVHDGKMEIGILVDSILGVCSVALDELQSSLPTLTGIRAQYLKGITKDPLVVLDMENILSDERLVVDEEISAAT